MKIAEWRKTERYKQKEVADMVGISYPHMSELESGKAKPSAKLIAEFDRITRGKVRAKDWQ